MTIGLTIQSFNTGVNGRLGVKRDLDCLNVLSTSPSYDKESLKREPKNNAVERTFVLNMILQLSIFFSFFPLISGTQMKQFVLHSGNEEKMFIFHSCSSLGNIRDPIKLLLFSIRSHLRKSTLPSLSLPKTSSSQIDLSLSNVFKCLSRTFDPTHTGARNAKPKAQSSL